MADFGQTDFGQPFWRPSLANPSLASVSVLVVWPTLAKTDFGQTDFGQTDFGLWCCVFCVVCGVFVCCVWVLVSRFHGVGFHVWVLVWSCSVLPGPPFPRTARPGTALPLDHPKFRAFFHSPAAKFVLFFSFRGSSRGILVVFEAPGRSNVHVWALWLSCETPV